MFRWLALGLISLYQRLISPLLPRRCRFYPTCSTYAADAVQTRGVVVGLWLTAGRLCRCHPFSAGGYDPVAGSTRASQIAAARAAVDGGPPLPDGAYPEQHIVADPQLPEYSRTIR